MPIRISINHLDFTFENIKAAIHFMIVFFSQLKGENYAHSQSNDQDGRTDGNG